MIAVSAIMAAALSLGSAAVNVDFSRGNWDSNRWEVVKGPRNDYCHGFVQRDSWLENLCPDLPGREIYEKHEREVYSCMLWKDRLAIGATISTTTGWDWRMAPLIVIAPEIGVAKDGVTPELREHWEVVVYDCGINVWHHRWTAEGKTLIVKAASLSLPEGAKFKANEKHALAVRIARNRKGLKEMVCTCGGYALQFASDSLPESFRAGILGCEGRNFFWDFSISQSK